MRSSLLACTHERHDEPRVGKGWRSRGVALRRSLGAVCDAGRGPALADNRPHEKGRFGERSVFCPAWRPNYLSNQPRRRVIVLVFSLLKDRCAAGIHAVRHEVRAASLYAWQSQAPCNPRSDHSARYIVEQSSHYTS